MEINACSRHVTKATLPANAEPVGPRHADVLAAVVRAVSKVCELQAALQFQLVAVKEVIEAQIALTITVTSTRDHAFLVDREAHTIGQVARDERVAPDHL